MKNYIFRIGMLDYGEFVPEALVSSQDPSLNTLGNKMDLIPLRADDEAALAELISTMTDGTHAITETYSYLR